MRSANFLRAFGQIARRLTLRYSLGQLFLVTAALSIAIFCWTNSVVDTVRELELAIVGKGYYQVIDDDYGSPTNGQIFYTREPHFALTSFDLSRDNSSDGLLSVRIGTKLWPLTPQILISRDFKFSFEKFSVEPDGRVLCRRQGNGHFEVGEIQLVQFPAGNLALVSRFPGLFRPVFSGACPKADELGVQNIPGTDGFGVLRQSHIGDRWEAFVPPTIVGLLTVACFGVGRRRSTGGDRA